jgi:hypothetical protein
MSLMDRIKIRHYLLTPLAERLEFLRQVREIRFNSLQDARLAKERKATARAKAPKTAAKRKTQAKNVTALQKALANMTPEQIDLLKEQYGL